MITFEIKNGWLIKHKQKINLTKLEVRLLSVLANNEINTIREIWNYVYEYNFYSHRRFEDTRSIMTIISRFRRKTGLNIKTLKGRGYKLVTNIQINY